MKVIPTPPARPRARATPRSADAGVWVVRPSLPEFRAWAEAKKAAGAKIDPEAVARARWNDATADDEVRAWLAASQSAAVEPAAPAAPPELSAEELNAQISVVAEMLRDGRTLPDIRAQLGGAVRRAQWRQIESAAEAQVKAEARVKPPAAESAPQGGRGRAPLRAVPRQ